MITQIIGSYDVTDEVKFKTAIIRSCLWYIDTYILAKGTMTITGAGADVVARQADERKNK